MHEAGQHEAGQHEAGAAAGAVPDAAMLQVMSSAAAGAPASPPPAGLLHQHGSSTAPGGAGNQAAQPSTSAAAAGPAAVHAQAAAQQQPEPQQQPLPVRCLPCSATRQQAAIACFKKQQLPHCALLQRYLHRTVPGAGLGQPQGDVHGGQRGAGAGGRQAEADQEACPEEGQASDGAAGGSSVMWIWQAPVACLLNTNHHVVAASCVHL
jgi:hypothetical protein